MKSILAEFKEFALRGSVVDLAVGFIIGAAFKEVVGSLVKDIILPPIGYLFGTNFSDLFYVLNGGHYDTLAQAQKAGVATINYGLFINTVITFILVAIAVFFLVKGINKLHALHDKGEEMSPTTKPCPFCITEIAIDATRCPNCTSKLPEKEAVRVS